ncbi:DUF2182 domain-containing protein [Lysobacter korlensis]|uniref:DUF2182 domain-containing protein n=1 Tax=Lysobacter korlensis TaxID=553636 RepID=A0ABV6S3C6_9GAMM
MSVLELVPQSLRPGAPRAGRAGRGLLAGSALAWVALLLLWLPLGVSGADPHAHHAVPGPSGGAPALDAWSPAWAGGWMLMVAAMMWPLLVPTVDRVARSAYPSWRVGLAATAVAASTALWLALGLAAASVAQVASVPAGSVWWQLAFVLVAAGAWRSARRTRLLWRCVKLPPVAPGGLRGVRDAAGAGVVAWRRCAALCGPLMIAMVVGHDPVVLVAASLSVWWEARHPRAWRDPVPLLLIGVAALGAVGGEFMTP